MIAPVSGLTVVNALTTATRVPVAVVSRSPPPAASLAQWKGCGTSSPESAGRPLRGAGPNPSASALPAGER